MFRFAALAFAAVTATASAAELTALPAPFDYRNGPVNWTATGPDSLTIAAGPKTNWFVPPWDGSGAADTAPTLLVRPAGDFTLSAKIAFTPKARWDAGVLTIFVDRDNWAKLCFENADGDGKAQVVMVVNKGVSDDSYTGIATPDNTLWLRVSRKGLGLYFHVSRDGTEWKMMRAFALNGDLSQLKAGLLAQSPVGDGATVTFSNIRYESVK
jgi:regulation of enolase protein 1 (concanavalin A-like superfamily)